MKLVTKNIRCYCFDFDDVLVKTDALIYVKKNNEIYKKLSSKDYTKYQLQENESYDFQEFHDPIFIENAKEHIMFNTLININNAIMRGESNSVVVILTARQNFVKAAIFSYFNSRGIKCIPMENIFVIDDNKEYSTSDYKKNVLEYLLNQNFDITFFDDDIRNIEIANSIKGVKTRHISDDDI